jgi:hypothetical protein
LKTTFISKEDPSGFIDLTLFVLNNLIDAGKITVRKIIKHKFKHTESSFMLYHQEGLKTPKPLDLRRNVSFMKNFNTLFVHSEDLGILKLFKLLLMVYGDFNDFYKDLNDLREATASQEKEIYSQMLSFLALQAHISKNIGDKLFFNLVQGNNYREQPAIIEIDFPKITVMNTEYRIKLNWEASSPYDGSSSYFLNAKAIDNSMHYVSVEPVKHYFKKGDVFNELKDIVMACQNKGYLHKSNIIFKAR